MLIYATLLHATNDRVSDRTARGQLALERCQERNGLGAGCETEAYCRQLRDAQDMRNVETLFGAVTAIGVCVCKACGCCRIPPGARLANQLGNRLISLVGFLRLGPVRRRTVTVTLQCGLLVIDCFPVFFGP